MGYDLELCRLCLQVFQNDLNKAIHFFLENKDTLHNLATVKTKLESMIAKTSKTARPDELDKLEKAINAKKLLKNIANDMSDDDEAYLDLNLEEDAFYINKYYSLLEI